MERACPACNETSIFAGLLVYVTATVSSSLDYPIIAPLSASNARPTYHIITGIHQHHNQLHRSRPTNSFLELFTLTDAVSRTYHSLVYLSYPGVRHVITAKDPLLCSAVLPQVYGIVWRAVGTAGNVYGAHVHHTAIGAGAPYQATGVCCPLVRPSYRHWDDGFGSVHHRCFGRVRPQMSCSRGR